MSKAPGKKKRGGSSAASLASTSFIGFSAVAAGFTATPAGEETSSPSTSSVGGPTSQAVVAPQPLYSGSDASLGMICKRLLKRDTSTKLKGLKELLVSIPDEDVISSESLASAIPHLAFLYLRLNSDVNWRVRDAAQRMLLALVQRDRKAMRPVMPSILGVWWSAQCDPATEVSRSSRDAMDAAFQSPTRRCQALYKCLGSICERLKELLFDSQVTGVPSQEVAEDQIERMEWCAVTGLIALSRLLGQEGLQLDIQQPGKNSNISSSAAPVVDLLRRKSLWAYLQDKRSSVRRSAFKLLTACAERCPEEIPSSASKDVLSLVAREQDAWNHGDAWEAALTLMRWSSTVSPASLAEIGKKIRKGVFWSSAETSYPCFLPLLSSVVVNDLQSQMDAAIELLDALWASIVETAPTTSSSALAAAVCAHAECATFLALRSDAQQGEIPESLCPVIARSFACPRAAERSLQPLSKILVRLSKASKSNVGSLDRCWVAIKESIWKLVCSGGLGGRNDCEGHFVGRLLVYTSELDGSAQRIQQLCEGLFHACRSACFGCPTERSNNEGELSLSMLALTSEISNAWAYFEGAKWPNSVFCGAVADESVHLLLQFMNSAGMCSATQVPMLLDLIKSCTDIEGGLLAARRLSSLVSDVAEAEASETEQSTFEYTAKVIRWAHEAALSHTTSSSECAKAIADLADGQAGNAPAVIKSCFGYWGDEAPLPPLIDAAVASSLLHRDSAAHALVPELAKCTGGEQLEPFCPSLLARAFRCSPQLWAQYGASALRYCPTRWPHFRDLVCQGLKGDIFEEDVDGSLEEHDAVSLALQLLALAELELLFEEDGSCATSSLHLSGITDVTAWWNVDSAHLPFLAGVVLEVFLHLSSSEERRKLLMRGSPSTGAYIHLLGEILCSAAPLWQHLTGDNETAYSLLFSSGGGDLWGLWHLGVATLCKNSEDEHLEAKRNGLVLIAEALTAEALRLEPPADSSLLSYAYRLPTSEELVEGSCFLRLSKGSSGSDGDAEALFDANVLLEPVTVVCVHQDPDGGEPFATVTTDDSREMQTPLSRLRLRVDAPPMSLVRGAPEGIPYVKAALEESLLPIMSAARTRLKTGRETDLAFVQASLSTVSTLLPICFKSLGSFLVRFVEADPLIRSVQVEWLEWQALLEDILKWCRRDVGGHSVLSTRSAILTLKAIGDSFAATPQVAHFCAQALVTASSLVGLVVERISDVQYYDMLVPALLASLGLIAASAEAACVFPPPLCRDVSIQSGLAEKTLEYCLGGPTYKLLSSSEELNSHLARALTACMKLETDCAAFPEPALQLSLGVKQDAGRWIVWRLLEGGSLVANSGLTDAAFSFSRASLSAGKNRRQYWADLSEDRTSDALYDLLAEGVRGSVGTMAASAYAVLSSGAPVLVECMRVKAASALENANILKTEEELSWYFPAKMMQLSCEAESTAHSLFSSTLRGGGADRSREEAKIDSLGGENGYGGDSGSDDEVEAENPHADAGTGDNPMQPTLSCFLAWLLVLDYLDATEAVWGGPCGGEGDGPRLALASYLRHKGSLNLILPLCFHFLSTRASEAAAALVLADASTGVQAQCIPAWLVHPDGCDDMSRIAATVYLRTALLFPSLVRSWYVDDCSPSLRHRVGRFTEKFVSPALVAREVATVRCNPLEMTVRASTVTREVSACYMKDECTLEMTIKLPPAYPLHCVEVCCTRRLGISEDRWRRWVLQIVTLLSIRDGSVLDAVLFWKRCVDREFEGMEPCVICYCTLHPKTMALPTQVCRTCSNGFHSECLYKWFNSSHKSQCPLCQQQWVN
jgi:hypothetical protein